MCYFQENWKPWWEIELTGCCSQVGITLFSISLMLSNRILFPPAENPIFQQELTSIHWGKPGRTGEFGVPREASNSPCPRPNLQQHKAPEQTALKPPACRELEMSSYHRGTEIHTTKTESSSFGLAAGRASRPLLTVTLRVCSAPASPGHSL